MFLIVIILFAAYILAPLADLTLNERVRVPVKIAIYALSALYILFVMLTGRMVV